MAGDWIKMRNDLPNDPAVYKIATLTKLDRFAVVGRLYAFWSWADKHAVDGRVDGASSHIVDDVTRHDGFAEALVSVNWLTLGEDFIALPHHERHNGESAKERGLKNARQARWREGKQKVPPTNVDGDASTKPSTREEKRREEIPPAKAGGGASASRPSKKCPASFEITDELKAWAAGNAPLVNLTTVTAAFRDHTFKNAITDWPGAWRNWLRKEQGYAVERAGSRRPTSHSGLASKNYTEGISADGTLI